MARIAGINIPQNKLVHVGLTYIYGIGDKFSKEICTSLSIPKETEKDLILVTERGALIKHKVNSIRDSKKGELGIMGIGYKDLKKNADKIIAAFEGSQTAILITSLNNAKINC